MGRRLKGLRVNVRHYIHNCWLVLDIAANAILFFGSPTETVSSRLGRWKDYPTGWKRRIAQPVCWLLSLFDKNHCDKTEWYERELGRHRPEALDDKPGD